MWRWPREPRRSPEHRPPPPGADDWFGDGSAFTSAEVLAAALSEMAATRAGNGEGQPSAASGGAPAGWAPPLGRGGGPRHAQESEETGRDGPARVRSMLDRGGAQPVYQPIVDLRAGRVTGMDALTRFSSGTPAEWFASAAAAGLSAEVETSAAAAALSGLGRLPGHVYLSLRFSASTLLHPATGALLARAPLGRVAIEIGPDPEGGGYDALASTLSPLRGGGLRVTLGTAAAGAMSLEQLLTLAPDGIKIDVSLMRDLGAARTDGALPHTLIAVARSVGATLVGHAIETAADLRAARQLGVDYGQGHLLARPAGPLIDEERIQRLLAPEGTGPGPAARPRRRRCARS